MSEKAGHRIAVRVPNWLGDCIMSTPFLYELRDIWPNAQITVFCRPEHEPIFKGMVCVDHVAGLPASSSASPARLRETARIIRENRFDLAYTLPTSFSSALLFYWAGVRERVGHAAEGRSFLLTRPVHLDHRFHYVRRFLSLVDRESLPSHRMRFFFPVNGSGRQEWQKLQKSLGTEIRKPMLVVAPGSQARARRYFPERFAVVVDRFVKNFGGSVVLLGSPRDTAVASELCGRASASVINLCGKTTLEGFGAVLKESAVLLANESGAMHVAWALGVPSVVLAGPSDTSLTAPWGEAACILQHQELWCVPCVRNECPRFGVGYKECLKLIREEEVWEALSVVLRRSPDALATDEESLR